MVNKWNSEVRLPPFCLSVWYLCSFYIRTCCVWLSDIVLNISLKTRLDECCQVTASLVSLVCSSTNTTCCWQYWLDVTEMCYSYFCHQSARYRSFPDGCFPSARIPSPCCPWQLPVNRRRPQERPVLEVYVAAFVVAVATTWIQSVVFGLIQVPFRFSLASVRSARALRLWKVTKWVKKLGTLWRCHGVCQFHTTARLRSACNALHRVWVV
jgi:hypothetical protein